MIATVLPSLLNSGAGDTDMASARMHKSSNESRFRGL
jgi:hypothetical protein